MSSIYKKGRDGYFYYQTYVFNLETGKKDKRIFHSLGTKNLEEAKEKKEILDKKYENLIKKDNQSKRIFQFNYFKILWFITCFTSLIIYFSRNTISKENIEISDYNNIENDEAKIVINIDSASITTDSLPFAVNGLPNIESKPKITPDNLVVPSFSIVKVDSLHGGFDQGKIFLTVEKGSTSNGLRMICDSLVKKYSGFSNIIICLYKDSNIGYDIASGKIENYDPKDIKSAWLAMYSYNATEGPYFDDDPGRYLSMYK